MQKTILITGATDGIGLKTAEMLVSKGHTVLLHGRNRTKLTAVEQELSTLAGADRLESYVADLSRMEEVAEFAAAVTEEHKTMDVLINNAGVFVAQETLTEDGIDIRFAVNTIAPYLLTRRLLPVIPASGRVVNLSSAAQMEVSAKALTSKNTMLSAGNAYAQSKLALTMWSRDMALNLGTGGPAVIAVNPKSFLGSKMVKEAYGAAGSDLSIGAEILCRAALSEEFANATGKYFDNDIGQFSNPHPYALDPSKCKEIASVMEAFLADYL